MKVKIISLTLVFVLLMVALAQISGIVHDRQSNRMLAVHGVAQSLAGPQTLVGPLIHIACTEEWDTVIEKRLHTERREFTLVAPPLTLAIQADSQLEPRSRGLHATQVFALKAQLAATWAELSALKPSRQHAGSRLSCGPVLLMMAVSDARGIRQASLHIGERALALKSGTFYGAYPRGVHAVLPTDLDFAAPLSVRLDLELLGTERISVVPLGGSTQMHLVSNWPHPSFGGQFLPAERLLTDAGFQADWRVTTLASTAQAEVLNNRPLCETSAAGRPASGDPADRRCVEAFGVRFIEPVDTYALSDRATKYGILFIGLTFVAVGLFEFMKALRVHPIQYLLVGAAISVFFMLLVSLAEHMAFALAYALSAAACALLLTYYASHMLRSWRRGGPLGLGVAVLYGLLFALLQLEQTALAVGAVALFLVLAVIMILTRRVDWYARLASPPTPTPTAT